MADINDIKADSGNDICSQATLLHPASGVWVRQAIDNIGWVDLGDEVLVVDALEQPELEQEIFEAIHATTGGKPVRHVINTHSHVDHVALNPAFQQRAGARIISRRSGAVPQNGIWQVQGPRTRVEVVHLPGAHTMDDCIVWLPAERILFTGDLFGWGLIPYNGNLRQGQDAIIRDCYHRMISLAPTLVVPGHGPVCSSEHLKRWLAYFDWLTIRLKTICQTQTTLDDALRLVPPPADMTDWWRFTAWKHQDSVKKLFKAIRNGWVGNH